ncbi:MAG: VWA domain-containing protein, partial [Chitinophagaceae bacterium]|nr:VWA domain-containing protein [Chitinophagaceae bacterium]
MRFFTYIIFAVLFCFSSLSYAQDYKTKKPRILILLDGSSSMIKQWTANDIRFEAAARIVDRLMDSVYAVNPNVEFALRVYGHQHPTVDNNCFDTKLEVQFSKDNYSQMMLRLAALNPLGVSPIAYSLQQAAEKDMLRLDENKYSLILITDGGESCDGNICAVVEQLLNKKIDFKPYILSLVDYAPLRQQYKCLGDYLLVDKPEKIEPVVGKIVSAYRRTFIQTSAVKQIDEPVIKTEPKLVVAKTPAYTAPVVKEEPKPTPPPVKKEEPKPIVPEPEKKSNIVIEEKQQREKMPLPVLGTARRRMLPQMYVTRSLGKIDVPKYIPPVFEEEVPPPPPKRPTEPVYKPMATNKVNTTPVVRNTPSAPKKVEATVTREEAEKTTLELYFWDGKGKYYQTAPEVVLLDRQTGKPVYKFNRTVDIYGNPRPQEDIPVGVFDFTITGADNYFVRNVEIKADQKNKLKFTVHSASLSFYYKGNKDRPVKEFAARVNKTLTRNAVTKQFCTDKLEYEPDNYHIEINT